jgi:hypothetical protein
MLAPCAGCVNDKHEWRCVALPERAVRDLTLIQWFACNSDPFSGPHRVIRYRGRASSNPAMSASYAPIATDFLQRREMTRWARSCHRSSSHEVIEMCPALGAFLNPLLAMMFFGSLAIAKGSLRKSSSIGNGQINGAKNYRSPNRCVRVIGITAPARCWLR